MIVTIFNDVCSFYGCYFFIWLINFNTIYKVADDKNNPFYIKLSTSQYITKYLQLYFFDRKLICRLFQSIGILAFLDSIKKIINGTTIEAH